MAIVQHGAARTLYTYGRVELWRRHRPVRLRWRKTGMCRCGLLLTQCRKRSR